MTGLAGAAAWGILGAMEESSARPLPQIWIETVFGLLLLFEPAQISTDTGALGTPVLRAEFTFPPWPAAMILVQPHGALGGTLPDPLMFFLAALGLVERAHALAAAETGVEWIALPPHPDLAILAAKAGTLSKLAIEQKNALAMLKEEVVRIRGELGVWYSPEMLGLLNHLQVGPERLAEVVRMLRVLVLPGLVRYPETSPVESAIRHMAELANLIAERSRGDFAFEPGDLPDEARVTDLGTVIVGDEVIPLLGHTHEEVKALAWRASAIAARAEMRGVSSALVLSLDRK